MIRNVPKPYFIRLLVFGLSFAFISNIYGQGKGNDTAFFNSFFQFQNKEQQELYIKEVNQQAVCKIREIIAKKDTLFQWNRRDRKLGAQLVDSFFFTAAEKTKIDQELGQQELGVSWPDQLAYNIKDILLDTVNYIFQDHKKGWKYFHKYYGRGFYSLIKPVFLRNATYCLFYYEYRCGSECSEGVLAMYRKEKGIWKHYITIYDWIS